MTLAQPLLPALGRSFKLHANPSPVGKREAKPSSLPVAPPASHTFETRRGGEALTVAPRTTGITALVPSGSPLPDAGEAAAAIARVPNLPFSPEAAREKVGFIRADGATAIYQADRQARSASLCACGNATGAAAALLARCLGRPEIRQSLHLPEGQVEARSKVSLTGQDAWQVVQSWEGIELTLAETELSGRRAAVCRGGLNDYLIVRLANAEELDSFDVPDALALWDAVRGPWGFADRLRSRLAVFSSGDRVPRVKFYTCGRMHPGAPLTGLATLAIAAERVSWLAPLLRAGEIAHRRGNDALPRVHHTARGAAITLPTIDVVLHGT